MKLRDWFELVRVQLKRDEGQTMAEYGLLVAGIALVAVLAFPIFGTAIGDLFRSFVSTFGY